MLRIHLDSTDDSTKNTKKWHEFNPICILNKELLQNMAKIKTNDEHLQYERDISFLQIKNFKWEKENSWTDYYIYIYSFRITLMQNYYDRKSKET